MKIKDFGVEIWMNKYENNGKYNLAETCVASLKTSELLEIAGNKEEAISDILDMQLTYGAIKGSESLRSSVAALYQKATKDNIIITHGAIGANSLVLETLVEEDDHVISVLPTYQQLYSIPEALGGEVDILKLKEEDNFLVNIEELKKLIKSNTKVININNPNNPTGSVMKKELLEEICKVAKEVNAYVFCDETYGDLIHNREHIPRITDLYNKGISTGSVSKAYSLAGLRIGWINGPVDFIEEVFKHRDYNTISCGMIDDYLANMALENMDKILKRNIELINRNKKILDSWVKNTPHISYIKPEAGTTALIKYDMDISSEELSQRLLKEASVVMLPGSAMEMEGYLRIGYANHTEVLEKGLEAFSKLLENF
ncbi:MAG TPA: aminotransferase [Clostridiales bacterium]|jgi:aspartate/methionine/tyrosine aminotransferase|nr:aminotransferase [Clostridiales bacterium]